VALLTEDNNSDIWIDEIARGTFTRLTFENKDFRPIWTPDGRRVTFASTRAGSLSLFWIPADGTSPAERLLQSEYAHIPTSWSPDGQHLAFVEIHPSNWWDIWILPLAGERKPRPFLRTPFGEGWAEFSPDGRWLAFSSNESGRWEAYVQPFPGPGGKVQLSTEGGAEVMWAPNGRELFYRDGEKMMAVAVTLAPTFAAGKPQVLFEGSYEMGLVPGMTNYDVARDGRFLMAKNERPSAPTRLEVVLNWVEELQRRVPAK
jgi:dipeptidyl aminopeptidase/acylaminoacyl peptidase